MGKKKRIVSEDYRIAYDFGLKTYKKFKEIIKAVILYGTVAKVKGEDAIDIIILIDDCVVDWDQELIAWYREELEKLVKAQGYGERLRLNTVTLTTFWEEVRSGEPLIINVIRYGQVLVDVGGFFDPLRVLLARGRIRPSAEAVYVTMTRASDHMFKANASLLMAVEGMHWAMIDAAHAVLMAENQVPVAPEFIASMLNEVFVSKGKLHKKYISYFEEVREVALKISKGEIIRIKGKDVDELFSKSEDFVRILRELGQVLLSEQKIIREEKRKL